MIIWHRKPNQSDALQRQDVVTTGRKSNPSITFSFRPQIRLDARGWGWRPFWRSIWGRSSLRSRLEGGGKQLKLGSLINAKR